MKKVSYQLETLTCPSCIRKIQGGLKKQAGITKAKVSFFSSKVKAEIDESAISVAQVGNIIEKLGFRVLSVKD